MATIAGKDADVSITGCDNHAHSWSMDIVCDPLEDTNWDWTGADVGWRSYISGLKGFSGSFEVYIDSALSNQCLPCAGEIASAVFYVDEVGVYGYRGDILITGAHPSVTIDGIESMTYDFQGTGGLEAGDLS